MASRKSVAAEAVGLKTASFLHLAPPLGAIPLEFRKDPLQHKTRVHGLLCGVVRFRYPLFSCFDTIRACDRQDGETDGRIHDDSKYCASMASCG